MLKNRLNSIYLLLLLFSCGIFSPPKIELEIPEEIPDRFILDFADQAGNITWDSLIVVRQYSEPSLNHLKGFRSISSLSKSDLYVLVLYIDQERVVGYSLVTRVLDLTQLWKDSNSLEAPYFTFSKNDSEFSFEKRGETFILNLDDSK